MGSSANVISQVNRNNKSRFNKQSTAKQLPGDSGSQESLWQIYELLLSLWAVLSSSGEDPRWQAGFVSGRVWNGKSETGWSFPTVTIELDHSRTGKIKVPRLLSIPQRKNKNITTIWGPNLKKALLNTSQVHT